MHDSAAERLALSAASDLERPLHAVEERLAALALALHERDAHRIEQEAASLRAALVAAVERFSRAARQDPIPAPLRRRLAAAGGAVAAQREVLARATASLDRAIDVLLPHPSPGLYAPAGDRRRGSTGDTVS
ncbi:MAG: hypothetical protein ABIX12_05095 [Rubrivivax sp.]